MTQSVAYRAPFGPGGDSPIDQELAAKLLARALSKGGDYADLFFEYIAGGGFAFEEGILKGASRGVSMGLGVRVQRGDATGYAYTEDLTWESMLRAAETAAQIAQSQSQTGTIELSKRLLPSRYHVEQVSLDIPGQDKRALLERASAAMHAYDPHIVKATASFNENIREIIIATSDGLWVHDIQPMFRFGAYAIAERNGKRQEGSSGGGGRMTMSEYFASLSPETHAKEASRQAITMLDAIEAPAGEMNVVLGPGDSGILLHEAVGHGLEADFNRKKTSRYADRIGEQVASNLCTVVDDATYEHARGAINVDDEGNTPTKSVLIEDGILVGYMHDRLSARHYKRGSTGNGRRESFRAVPLPRMTNTVLLAGPHDPEEILRSVKRGVFARKFGGGQVTIENGDFNFSLTEAYLIEDGKLTAPMKGVTLIGNGPDVLTKVSMLGDDLKISDGIWTCGKEGQSVPVGVGCPTVKIDRITVGGTRIN